MRVYYITGASRGIGKALSEKALEKEDAYVYGISRTHTIEHSRYIPVELDLSDLDALKGWNPQEHKSIDELVLINNAGSLGSIKPVGTDDDDAIERSFDLNLIAPAILTNKFARIFEGLTAKKLIVNVSSGAGKNAIDGWSTYCASKAGLDMYGAVVQEEQNIHQLSNPFKILSIAPGVVETTMQEEIRSSSENDFSSVQRFRDLKSEEQLSDPSDVAEKYFRIMNDPSAFSSTEVSVREVES